MVLELFEDSLVYYTHASPECAVMYLYFQPTITCSWFHVSVNNSHHREFPNHPKFMGRSNPCLAAAHVGYNSWNPTGSSGLRCLTCLTRRPGRHQVLSSCQRPRISSHGEVQNDMEMGIIQGMNTSRSKILWLLVANHFSTCLGAMTQDVVLTCIVEYVYKNT